MNHIVPHHGTHALLLHKRIEEKIALLKAMEKDLPPVIIVHDLRTTSVIYMSQRGLDILGITMKELIGMGPDYHGRFFNSEDAKDYVPKIMGLLERNNDDEVISIFQQVKTVRQNDWEWYLSCVKILMHDDNGIPLLTITSATPIDAQHHIASKAQRLVEENNFLRHNNALFNSLTRREKEVLGLMASGMSAVQIAKKLHIAELTAATHRRNIKNKINAGNNYDITRFAQAFDLI